MRRALLRGIWRAMIRIVDMDDRARLRERFFGATHTVLARL
ncbi:isopropylmalate isomerase [uncultured Roseobacter sp.]|nr:isopropylmalate isomerase [uncultured Roseobacter sp.]